MVLTSLVLAALEQEYPGLVSVEQGDKGQFISEVEKNVDVVLDNEEKITLMSLDSWLEDLSLTPPGGAARKKANLAEELSKYFTSYHLTAEEQALVKDLTEDEQSYLVASLGRSRGKRAFVVYWMLRHNMFKYILYHENFHTFTTEKINLYNQLDISQKKGTAEELGPALFVYLWLKYVGNEKEVFFSNYGQTSQHESLSEFFARLYTRYFAKDLGSIDWAKDAKQTKSYIAAFVIADCFSLFETYDLGTGSMIKEEVLKIINGDANKKQIYDELKVLIDSEAGGCPVVLEPVFVEGTAYKCNYRGKEGNIKVDSCELVELPGEVAVGGETFVGRYDSNGNYIGSIPVATGNSVITETGREDANELAELPEMSYEEYGSGEVVVPADGPIVEFLTPGASDAFGESGMVNLEKARQDGMHRVEVEADEVILAIEEVAAEYGLDLLIVVDSREPNNQIALEGKGGVFTLLTPVVFWDNDLEKIVDDVVELIEFKTDAEYEGFFEKVWALLFSRTPSGYEQFMRLSAQVLNQLDERGEALNDLSGSLDNFLSPGDLIMFRLGEVLDALNERGKALDSLSLALDNLPASIVISRLNLVLSALYDKGEALDRLSESLDKIELDEKKGSLTLTLIE